MAAIKAAFDEGRSVDYGTVVKHYARGGNRGPDYRYEPPREPFVTKHTVFGAPKEAAMSTSHVERYHLTARHINGRKRRLCLYFSKKPENHKFSEAISVFAYNFLRVHASLDATPAVAAGLADHQWTVEEMVVAALAEPAGARPEPAPLAAPAGRGAARPLPGGGWLRAVAGPAPGPRGPAKAAPPPSPPPAPAAPPAPAVAVAPAPVAVPEADSRQLDLLAWRPRPRGPAQPERGQLVLLDV